MLEYDDVANDQRRVVYQQRAELMEATDIADAIRAIRAEVINTAVNEHVAPDSVEEEWNKDGLTKALERDFGLRLDIAAMLEADHSIDEKALRANVVAAAAAAYDAKVTEIGPAIMHEIEKQIMLRQLDSHWKEHIGALDYLRQGIHLRGYAQRNPKQEYKREAFEMFSTTLERVKHDTVSILSKIQIRRPEDVLARPCGLGWSVVAGRRAGRRLRPGGTADGLVLDRGSSTRPNARRCQPAYRACHGRAGSSRIKGGMGEDGGSGAASHAGQRDFPRRPAAWRTGRPRVEPQGEIAGGSGYRIRKLRYEALPGLWVPALLYEPERLEGRVPVGLAVNGHDPLGKAAKYKQLRCINMAKRGMLALNVEWLGMGQLTGSNYVHYRMNQLDLCGASGLAPFYLAMSRGLDLLCGMAL